MMQNIPNDMGIGVELTAEGLLFLAEERIGSLKRQNLVLVFISGIEGLMLMALSLRVLLGI